MAEPARRRMTLEEFLSWDDGTDTRYEFAGGEPVAMDPANVRHGRIERSVGRAIEDAIGLDGPCFVADQVGINVEVDGESHYYVADLAMSCETVDDDRKYLEAPRLIVEVMSESTRGIDKRHKVPAYCVIPSVEEVWLIDNRQRWVMVWQRVDGQWVGSVPYTKSAAFASRVLDAEVGLDRLYRNTGL